MPNHVHLLVTPQVVSSRWLAPLKGFTAFQANELLGRHGQAFLQDESYDHLIRSQAQFERIRTYIEQNPATAGLIGEADQYLWSSAAGRLEDGCGPDWPHICPFQIFLFHLLESSVSNDYLECGRS